MDDTILTSLKEIRDLTDKLIGLEELPPDILQCIDKCSEHDLCLKYELKKSTMFVEIMTRLSDLVSLWKEHGDCN